ncbi:T9SS type A sorting domain-containing protein [Seonamhaeicola marinus]|uniref:T9SS type A sorting domain-containing protein n=1 Tax=Seonamhaeicola marinus TaxID=1912246 RepID=A0A5D0H3U8_9FLAO|nr:right-handed parallel beta-helix repeat-containing protein [Seonamhaeicola marinus]TYA65946.1 T9SS type A sorting domain-containing protein [Seonamhaeicola marinus]
MLIKKYALIAQVFFISLCTYAKDIYVAKNGDDSNPGTMESPYLTISKAASVAVAGDIVYIREGTYEETLSPANSGTAGNPIIFQSYPGEKVIISAMEALSGWTQDSGSIYKTTISFNSLGQNNFVVNDKTPLNLARWPNKTSDDPFILNSIRNTGGSDGNTINGAYLTESSIPGIDWTGGALWFYGDRPGSGWTAWKRQITSSSAGRVNFNFTAGQDWIRTFHPPADKGDFYLEGVKEALDYQNEWYYEDATNTLYVQLPGGVAPEDGKVHMRRRIETINLKDKKYIEIRNLALYGGNINMEDSSTWHQTNANTRTTNIVLYGVSVFYGNHTQGVFDGVHTGKAAIKVQGSDHIIEKCEVAFNAASGIDARGNNLIIRNNYVHDCDFLAVYDGPLIIRGINNTLVKNNTIFNGGRDAIQYNGETNEIAYNNVYKSNRLADDCALFYTVGPRETVTEIHHNWFHDTDSPGTKYKAAGIYLDNSASKYLVHHNVVWNTEWTNIQINWDGADINIYNNTLWNGSAVMGAWHKDGTQFTNVNVWNNLSDDDNWEPQSDKQNNMQVTSDVFVNLDGGDFNLKAGASPIDQGKQIAGITDGFIGANPDVGAYENGGDNWTAGIDWIPLYGPTGQGCYGLPGENCVAFDPDDDDNDGVDNADDLCPDTPLGTTVNTDGCEVFTIPASNFKVRGIGESCRASDDGAIAITSIETTLQFKAKITETGTEKDFTSDVMFSDLEAGDYTVCITTTEDANYEQCFSVTILEPEDLSVISKIGDSKSQITLSLSGGSNYSIELNGTVIETSQNEITLPLVKGVNNISVKADRDCQGKYFETISVFDDVTVYPNTVKDSFTIAFPEKVNAPVTYEVISATGKVIISKTEKVKNQRIQVNTQSLSAGMYFVKINAQHINSKTKIVKQ